MLLLKEVVSREICDLQFASPSMRFENASKNASIDYEYGYDTKEGAHFHFGTREVHTIVRLAYMQAELYFLLYIQPTLKYKMFKHDVMSDDRCEMM